MTPRVRYENSKLSMPLFETLQVKEGPAGDAR